jgi:hypothetical protein
MKNEKHKKSVSFISGAGNILTWKGETKNDFQTTQKDNNEIKRRNPNQTSCQEPVERKTVKLNKMLYSSSENFLNNKII